MTPRRVATKATKTNPSPEVIGLLQISKSLVNCEQEKPVAVFDTGSATSVCVRTSTHCGHSESFV